jgi:hypothetical protein
MLPLPFCFLLKPHWLVMSLDILFLQKQQQRELACDPVWKEGNISKTYEDYSRISPPVFSGVRVTRSLVLYVCFVDHCLPFCAFSFLAILFSVLRYTDSDYPHGIFNLFFDIYVLLILPSFHTGSHASSRCCCFWRNRMSRDITNQWGFSRKQNTKDRVTRTPLKTGGEILE